MSRICAGACRPAGPCAVWLGSQHCSERSAEGCRAAKTMPRRITFHGTSRQETTLYSVRLSIPRNGGWRDWGTVSGRFEQQLANQESRTLIGPHIERETRRGADDVRATISVAVDAPSIAQALTAAPRGHGH